MLMISRKIRCAAMCGPLGNKVTLIYPNKRAQYIFVNVNLDVADGFNVHYDVETKKKQLKKYDI